MSGGRQSFALDYIDVAERIVEFRTKHPDGSLQQVAIDFREVNGGWWVIYTAAAYRTADDPRPGIGTAWEPIPGKTNFTRDNEVQNAETAAWGRAMVAALAVDTKRGIASAEEVRNSQERQQARQQPAAQPDLRRAATPPPAESGDDGEPEVSKVAQVLADLAAQMTSVERLKAEVQDPASARRLLSKPVRDPITGAVTVLSQVITNAKAHLTQQTQEGSAA